MIFRGYLFGLLYGVLCILISLFAYKLGMPKKYTRKIVHILVGFEWVILYYHFGTGIHFIAVCLIFTALLIVTYAKKLMPMIASDGENAPGTVYYGTSMTVMAIISYFVPEFVFPFGIAVFCTSIGDGFAGVFGSFAGRMSKKIYKSKTLVGTLAAFIFSLSSVIVFAWIFELPIGLWHAVAIALLSAGLELITGYGLDNITLPLGTSVFSYFIIYSPETVNYILPIIFTPFVIAAVLAKGVLTPRGVVVAVIMDIAVSVAFGNFGFVLLLSFLFLSVVVDKIKKHFRKTANSLNKRGDKRDEIQVIANGIISVLMAVCYLFSGEKVFAIAYTAALAEAFADTCASGFGALSSSAFDIFRMKRTAVGLSGGISWQGTTAQLIAAFAFPLIALAFGVIDFNTLPLIGVAAFAGALFDSFLGSVFQAKYKCPVCGVITEQECHCETDTVLCSGNKHVNNDIVNLSSTAFAAAFAAIIYMFM